MNLRVDLASIEESKDPAELRDRTVTAFHTLGFGGAYFITPVTTDRRFGRVISCLDVPAEFIEEYQQGLREADPLPDSVLRAGRALRWSEATTLAPLTAAEQAFMARVDALGMHDGVACITHGPSGRTGFVGITFPESEDSLQQDVIVLCHTIAQMAFLRYCEFIDRSPAAAAKLSARELDVLQWMAQGKSNSVIADILGISAETVDSYVRRVFAKLDVTDRTSAVVNAVLGGHLFAGPYRRLPTPLTPD